MPKSYIGETLSSLPVAMLIATPLIATAEAQKQLAGVTLQFLKDLMDGDVLQTLVFTYASTVITIDEETGEETHTDTTITYTVPLLALVPVPSLAVTSVDVDLTVKVSQASKIAVNAEMEAKAKGFFWSARFKASMSYENKKSQSATYSVRVHAEQLVAPGLEKMIEAVTTGSGPTSE